MFGGEATRKGQWKQSKAPKASRSPGSNRPIQQTKKSRLQKSVQNPERSPNLINFQTGSRMAPLLFSLPCAVLERGGRIDVGVL